ncbi:hypothetical protein MUK42_35823 [Musa troglodytarum]|uniref:Uncharacterized protein n=1 Tax=Musa troglodytarum TaxID=320322 RepID=A0A9E7HE12_9LILI|nr:hypothetical protein MUK42_35823 [Musa troglodytarum]URE28168.1 hypothetical protein MUK42_35823 [Musa troglodytarum]
MNVRKSGNGRGLSEEDDSRNNEALEDKESGDSPLGQLLELSRFCLWTMMIPHAN